MKKVYYAHSMRDYNSQFEKDSMQRIQNQFPDMEIVNPNGDMSESRSMEPYLKMVQSCYIVVFTMHQYHIGKGVYAELKKAEECGIPILLLEQDEFFFVEEIKVINESDWKVEYAKPIPKLKFGWWKDKNHRLHKISEMKDSYIDNIISMLDETGDYKDKLVEFINEKARRTKLKK